MSNVSTRCSRNKYITTVSTMGQGLCNKPSGTLYLILFAYSSCPKICRNHVKSMKLPFLLSLLIVLSSGSACAEKLHNPFCHRRGSQGPRIWLGESFSACHVRQAVLPNQLPVVTQIIHSQMHLCYALLTLGQVSQQPLPSRW